MMMESPSDPEVRTTRDLTLATYLIMMCGFGYTIARAGQTSKGHPLGAWEFPNTGEVREKVKLFEEGKVRVEPRQFYEDLKQTRIELFKELGVAATV